MELTTFTESQVAELKAHMDAIKDHDDEYIAYASIVHALPGVRSTIATLVSEIFGVLNVDGGVQTAQFLIEQINAGHIHGDFYIDINGCGCFYGNVCIAEKPLTFDEVCKLSDDALFYDATLERITKRAQELMQSALENDPDLSDALNHDGFTPVEYLLMKSRARNRHETPDTSPVLAFMRYVLQLYVAMHAETPAMAQ